MSGGNDKPRDSEDLRATVPAKGWDLAATVPVTPAPPVDPNATVPALFNVPVDPQATIPAARPATDATRPTHVASDARLAETRATALPAEAPGTGGALTGGATSQSQAFSKSFSRTGRTRINLNLPAEAQHLDVKLQQSRSSVLADMATARISKGDPIPSGIRKLIEEQGTEGRYAINRPLAAGGMGAVLHIEDHDFRRAAAMKVIHGRFSNHPEAIERFLAEAQVTAQLEHPNIVPIHDLGVMDDGTLYFTMKLIEGVSLGKVVKLLQQQAGTLTDRQHQPIPPDAESAAAAAKWSEAEKLLAFLKVLDGVGFAHSRGVVHRDIKPDNIMLGLHGEVLVVDWGIAKVLGTADRNSALVQQVASIRDRDSLSATMEGSAMGTIYYMPPEQATGKLDEVDARSDVYALGATLYELLALKRSVEGPTLPDLLAKVATGNYIPLNVAAPALSPDLVAIVHRAMALTRDRRYASCADFAADLRRYLAGQAVLARRRNLIERLGLWYAQHRRQVQAGIGAAVLLAVAVGGTLAWQDQARRGKSAMLLADARKDVERHGATGDIAALDAARDRLAQAAVLLPGDGAIVELRGKVEAALAEAKRLADQEKEKRAAEDRANQLLIEGTKLKIDSQLEEAEQKLSAAFQLAPKNGAVANELKEVVRLRANARELVQRQEAREQRHRGDQLLERAARLDPADPAVEDAIKKAEEAFTLAEKDISVEGTQAQIKAATLLRARSAAARKDADDRRKGQDAVAKARQALADKRFAEAKEAIAQGLGFLPNQPEAMALRDQILAAELADQQAKAAAEKLRQSQDATVRARAALKAGDLAAARDAAAQAWGHAPGNADADQVRQEVAEREREAARQAARDASLTEARQKAAAAMAQARAELAKLQAGVARQRIALANLGRLTGELTGVEADQKGALWAAHREAQAAGTEVSERWSLTEAAAQNVLGFLADDRAHALNAEARGLLSDLYQARLADARQRRDLPNITAFANLLRRYDDGRYAALLADLGRLSLSGPAGTVITVRALSDGADLRLQPVGEPMTVSLPAKELELKGGRYQLSAGDVLISVVVSAGAQGAVAWPGALPALPGMALRYVPAAGGGKAFLLGQYEVTHDQYFQYLSDPAVFPRVQAAWKAYFTAADQANHDLGFVPRQGREVSWQAKASDAEGAILSELSVPKELLGLPVWGVTRADAEGFCAWLAKRSGQKIRLPTLGEWQLAAHGGDERRQYPWGEVFDEALAVTAYGAGRKPRDIAAKVGSRPGDVGPFGHADLAGNVREWVGDRAGIHGALVVGGSWSDERPEQFRTTAWESIDPTFTGPVFGFRILMELP
jgi:serine/threonine protein kinase